MRIAQQGLSLAQLAYRYAAETKGANISNKRNIVRNPNWQEADKLAMWIRLV